ncbi:hypothetical protein GCM10011591_42980 [Nocardia camponoti]|uniref:Luciferase-like domain-containing protein n=1 Tax=Nocardia camponoti TaxID=1616106 RepID=A0A917QT28_9NOCA|nr:hypothetical protein GCM10011591_42980 [Nocardia camponoti]
MSDLLLGLETAGTGTHPASWRRADSRAEDVFGAAYWTAAVARAEALGFDAVLVPDSFGIAEGDGVARGQLDAVAIAARTAPVTLRIALIPQVSVTHTEPFHVSKAVAALDFASLGRAGWEVTVSSTDAEAKAFGRKEIQDAESLWAEAEEAVEVATRLWDSWQDDAEIRGTATGRFIDRARVHYIDFVGEFFSVKGPSITPRSPQGQPVVVVRADSPESLKVAARRADVVRVGATADLGGRDEPGARDGVSPANTVHAGVLPAVPDPSAQSPADGQLSAVPDTSAHGQLNADPDTSAHSPAHGQLSAVPDTSAHSPAHGQLNAEPDTAVTTEHGYLRARTVAGEARPLPLTTWLAAVAARRDDVRREVAATGRDADSVHVVVDLVVHVADSIAEAERELAELDGWLGRSIDDITFVGTPAGLTELLAAVADAADGVTLRPLALNAFLTRLTPLRANGDAPPSSTTEPNGSASANSLNVPANSSPPLAPTPNRNAATFRDRLALPRPTSRYATEGAAL